MAVSIDTVYQRVLALANKEQRGYITPQEFNLFANQAQQEIFEQYFYDLNQVARIPGNEYVYADVDNMLEEKLQIFEHVDGPGIVNSYTSQFGANNIHNKKLPDYIYRVSRIEFNNVDCEILKTKDFQNIIVGGPLTKSSAKKPVANIKNNVMRVLGGGDFGVNNEGFVLPTGVYYFQKPDKVEWGYFVINDKALHDTSSSKTTNFELHASEETELVYKILKFAGVSIQRQDIMQAGQGMETFQIGQEKQ